MAKCVICKSKFTAKFSSLQRTCGISHAIIDARQQQEKKIKLEAKKNRKALKQYKYENMTVAKCIKKTQPVFNKYIRLRDFDLPCISCGRYDWEIKDYLRGGKWDCGHFKTVGAYPELRFEPLNAHKQCKSCNGGSGKYTRKNHTVGVQYEENLIVRIGLEKVEWLNGPHLTKNYTVDGVRAIELKFAKMTKDLEIVNF